MVVMWVQVMVMGVCRLIIHVESWWPSRGPYTYSSDRVSLSGASFLDILTVICLNSKL